jgi:hypothetical protein
VRGGCLAAACLAACLAACRTPEPSPMARDRVTGTLTVAGAPARLLQCRVGHAVHVFVEVDTTLGTLGFGEGKLSWRGGEQVCQKLDRSWGGGVRQDGSAYFHGTLDFRCGPLAGNLALDCGRITPAEAAELARNRAAAQAEGAASKAPNP